VFGPFGEKGLTNSRFSFRVKYLYGDHDLDDELTVPDFEALIKPSIETAIQVAEAALVKAKLDASDLTAILLAGGTSQIPLVKDMLQGRFDLVPQIIPNDLMWLIARGAAIYHRDLMTRPGEASKQILGADLYLQTYGQGRLTDTLLVPSHQTLPYEFINDFVVNPLNGTLVIQLLTETGSREQSKVLLEKRLVNVEGLGLSKISVKVSIDRNKSIKLGVLNPKTGLPLANVEIKGELLSTSEELIAARKQYGFKELFSAPSSGRQNHAIGIDLGTTTCEVIVWGLQKQEFWKGIAEPQISQVLIRDSGVVSVDNGEYGSTTHGYFSNFKVDIGTKFDASKYTANNQLWPPEILSAHLLATIWKQVRDQLGESAHVSEAVITVPSDFSEDQVALVQNAAKIAGITTPILLPEPVAAFLAYADRYAPLSDPGQRFLIFDFGGGTTDVCVVETGQQDAINILSTSGNNAVGGKDLTNKISDSIISRFVVLNKLKPTKIELEKLRRRLFPKAELAKVELSKALIMGEV
jgi:molecular chaperone DnaK (HSP70)